MRSGKWRESCAARVFDVIAARERDLQRQVTLAKNQLRDLQTSNESTQAKLLNHNERQGGYLGIYAQRVTVRLTDGVGQTRRLWPSSRKWTL